MCTATLDPTNEPNHFLRRKIVENHCTGNDDNNLSQTLASRVEGKVDD